MTDVSVDPTSSIGAARESGAHFVPHVRDYIDLLKPRVMSLVVFTALVGMLAAPGDVHPFLGFAAILAIAVGAGASGALNMWYDADIDARMRRTRTRPLPAKRLAPSEALTFGVVLAVLSVLTMALAVNYFAAALLALTIGFYVFVYTMWLKRSTPQNIVIGGAAGAFPPMIGWAAVTGSVSLESIVLFLIIFLWTPPHFWALALYRCSDYADVGVPMLPVVAGKRATRRQILLYTLLLVPVTLSPLALGLGGWLYGVTAVIANVGLVALAMRIWILGEGKLEGGRDAEAVAKHMFAYSILYLFALFAALFVEHL